MVKVMGFIDGFNLYHALTQEDEKGSRPYAKYRWLDYWKLTECFLGPGDSLEAVHYFTAFVAWDSSAGKEKRERHQAFVEVQRDRNVKIIEGRFRPVWKQCKAVCKKRFQTYEEKRTDVNIAVTMLKLAVENKFEKAILITGDSDLIPALEAIRVVDASSRIMVVVPVGRTAIALSNQAHFVRRMKESHLKRCVLPQEVTLKNGVIIQCPEKWR